VSKRNRKQNTRVSVDVVVTTAGRFDMLRECLAALDRQDIPHNVFIVDIGTDSKEWKDVFDGRSVKHIPQNIGFPAGANEGARMGSAPLILFLNDDAVLFDGALAQMVNRMNDQTLGICGAKLIFPPTSTSPIRPAGKVQHVGLALNSRAEVIHPLVGWSPDNPKTLEPRDVFAVTGACLMIRRVLFSKVGGFDTIYGLGTFEDADICLKIRSMGFRVYVDTHAKAYHYTGANAEKKQVSFPLQRNLSIFRERWGGTPLFVYDEWTHW
jgi:O-antigen biosynthesis protein